MRDRAAEPRFTRRALAVDVDPLMVAGGVGELVDSVLGDLEPVAGRDLAADPAREFVDVNGLLGHDGDSATTA